MKKLLWLGLFIGSFGCNSDAGWDCIQTSGELIREEVEVESFDKIQIENEVALFLRQGTEHQVVIEIGSNLRADVSVTVIDKTLTIVNTNTCNLIREYEPVRAYVTVTDLSEIRNSSIYSVQSESRLVLPNLRLISNTSGNATVARKSGDFNLNLQCDELVISANGQSVFYLEGTVKQGLFVFTDEFPRLEGASLLVDTLEIRQRSANIMQVNPRSVLKGVIQGVGDVESFFRPQLVDVEELYTGRLIFVD